MAAVSSRDADLAFLTNNHAIYCFSVTFGPLFLLWVGVLGLSMFALIIGAVAAAQMEFDQLVLPTRFAACVLMTISTLFAGLWLAEIIGDLWAGSLSTSATDWEVPTNPVYVLDLAFLLPGAFLAGLRLRSGSRIALAAAPGLLILFALTCLPVVATPVVASFRGHVVVWGAVGPIPATAVVTLIAFRSVLSGSMPEVSQAHRRGVQNLR